MEHFRDRYQCHVITLPGFAGQPAVDGPLLPRLRDEPEFLTRQMDAFLKGAAAKKQPPSGGER